MSLINSWKPFGVLVRAQELEDTHVKAERKQVLPASLWSCRHHWGTVTRQSSGHFALPWVGYEARGRLSVL